MSRTHAITFAKKLLPTFVITIAVFLNSNVLISKTSKAEVNKRIDDLIALYNYASVSYNQNGPHSFWKTFAYLANEKEIEFLMKGTKGYPDLPTLKHSALETIEVTYQNKLFAKIVVIDFDQQHYSINGTTLKIPIGASIEEISSLFEKQILLSVKNDSKWKRFVFELFSINSAYAGGKRNKNAPKQRNGFLSRLFGAGVHSYNGVPSVTPGAPSPMGPTGSHAGATAAEGFAAGEAPQREAIPPSPTPAPANLPNGPLKKLPDSYRIPKGLAINNSGVGCNLIIGRHGKKDGDKLTSDTGVPQSEDLAVILSEYERNYEPIELVFNSNLNRSTQTAAPFKKAKGYNNNDRMHQIMGVLVRECIGDKSCKRDYGEGGLEKVREAFPKGVPAEPTTAFREYFMREVCKGGKSIYISTSGSFLTRLFNDVGVNASTAHSEARAHLLTVSGTGKFDLIFP